MVTANMMTLFIAFFEVYPPKSGAAFVSWDVARFWPGKSTIIQSAAENREEIVGTTAYLIRSRIPVSLKFLRQEEPPTPRVMS